MISFYKTKVIEQEHTVSVEEFVLEYLEEIRIWGDQYDFYVSCGVNRGYISRVFTIPIKDCPIADLDDDDCIIKALNKWKYGE